MLFNKEDKKIFLYEVDPLFFKDSNDDGFGDFRGFISKIDYFNFLNIDGIIFPDIFNQEKIIAKPLEETVFDKYGKVEELQIIINELNKRKIDFFITINLQNISSSMLNKATKDLQQNKRMDILLKSTHEIENENNWSSQTNINSLKKILNFWTKLGVNNFIFTDFELLYSHNEKELNQITIEQLHQIYDITKKTNNDSIVVLKSHKLDFKSINYLFKNYIGKICDLYIDNSYAFVSTNKWNPLDIKEKFNPSELINKISRIKINHLLQSRYIISFGSNLIGRVLSRWMDEDSLHVEAAKTLLMLIHLLPFSSINYYGDELGMLRMEVTSFNQYYDFSFIERKRKLENRKFTEQDFFDSQKYLSKINSQSFFIWDETLNFGFSNSKNLIRNLTHKSENLNVKKQYKDLHSILHFYKTIIQNLKHDLLGEFINNQSIVKIKSKKSNHILVYKIRNKNSNKIFIIIINPTNKFHKTFISKNSKVLLSSYSYKTYQDKIFGLNPYESLVIIKK